MAIELATFGRMYGMFLFAVLAASLLSIRAGARGRPWDWALAGAAAGALVYVHPIAPLYVPFALATGIACSDAPLRSFVPGLRAALIAAAAVAAPYVWALAVLARRYEVGAGGSLGQAGDRSVVHESLLGLTPGRRLSQSSSRACRHRGRRASVETNPASRSSSDSGSSSRSSSSRWFRRTRASSCGISYPHCRHSSCWSRRERSRSDAGEDVRHSLVLR